MKKLLALVLALVMTLGLATVAANASFPDAADIDLTEAADVMAAVGVFKGDEKGNFAPKANLDRAAAAKLIAYLDLGEKTAEALPAVQVFNDVPATHWAAKYIAYCADAGYIAGSGDGNFYPSNSLTGYAFGKMVLCVLGYDAAIEGFTGSTWSINVAKKMQDNKIADGVDAAASANLTREQAAQYCFNALQATMVEYSSKGTTIEINGATIATGASKATAVGQGSYSDTMGDNTSLQLAEKLYGTKLVKSTASSDFGANTTTWKYNGKKVGGYETEDAILTYTTELKEKDLFTALDADGISGVYAKFIVLDEIWVDGVQVAAAKKNSDTDFVADTTLTTRDAAYDNTVVIAKADSSNMAGPGNGVTTSIYAVKDSNGDTVANHYKMVCVKEYIGKITAVTKANATTGAARKVTVAGMTYETEDFAKNDWVLYTKSGSEIKSMTLATKIENVAVSAYSNTSVTAGGTTYKYSQEQSTIEDKGAYKMTSGDSYTFFLDSNGYVIKGEAYSASSTDYFFVSGAATPTVDDFDASKYVAKYQLVGMDGKVVTVKQIEADATADADPDDIVTYKDDDDNAGYVKITKVAAYDSSASSTAGYKASTSNLTSFSKTAATQNGVSFNNSTVFVLKTGSNTYKVVNGLSAMDNWSSLNTGVYTVTKSDVATVAFMDCYNGGSAATSSSTDTLVYVISTSATTSYNSSAKKTIYTYKTTDGTISATDGTIFTAEGLWKITNTESGYVKAATQTLGSKYAVIPAAGVKVSYSGGVLTINGTSYVIASGVSVTMADDDNNVTADADIEALVGDAVKGEFTLVATSTSDATIKTIYFNGTVE